MKYILAYIICSAFLITGPAIADEADAIIGEWYTKDSKALVQIYKSGETYNGKIIWLKEPFYEDGTEKRDKNNPDESRHQDKIIGLNLVKDFVYKAKNKWADGTIYDPDNGKTYSCKMTLTGDNELKVRGFIGVSLIGRTQMWQRK
jgi:uncharacterized protein (DUF2147 family)